MKQSNNLLVVLGLALSWSGAGLSADQPHIIPGRPVEVKGDGKDLVAQIVRHSESLQEVMKHGSSVLDVGVTHHIESSDYQVLVGSCTLDPAHICVSKALLTITASYVAGHRIETVEIRKVHGRAKVANALTDASAAVVEAMGNVARQVQDLSTRGEVVTLVEAQFISPMFHRVRVIYQYCRAAVSFDSPPNAGCLGGAALGISVRTNFDGVVPTTTYIAEVTNLR